MGTNAKLTIKQRLENFKAMEKEDKRRWWGEFFIDNSLYIFLIAAIIGIAVYNPNFVSMKSIINIVSLSAANLPIALGIAGAIILTGTDLSAGRVVGLTACVAASLLQMAEYPNKMFPGIGTVPVPIVILAVIAIGALVGAVNGFCTAKFNLHPFIVTLATQLIVYGTLLIYLMQGNNNGQSISGLDKSYTNLITGSILSVPDGKGNMVPIPNFVWYAIVVRLEQDDFRQEHVRRRLQSRGCERLRRERRRHHHSGVHAGGRDVRLHRLHRGRAHRREYGKHRLEL